MVVSFFFNVLFLLPVFAVGWPRPLVRGFFGARTLQGLRLSYPTSTPWPQTGFFTVLRQEPSGPVASQVESGQSPTQPAMPLWCPLSMVCRQQSNWGTFDSLHLTGQAPDSPHSLCAPRRLGSWCHTWPDLSSSFMASRWQRFCQHWHPQLGTDTIGKILYHT